MDTESVTADSPGSWQRSAWSRQWFTGCARRLIRSGTEAGYDAIVWVSGLCYAAWVTGDIPGGEARRPLLLGAVLLIPLLSVVCGLLAGLYRGRHPRGSLDEVISVFVAGGLMLVPLALLSGVLASGQRHPTRTVAVGALIALPTMAVARYVVFTARQGGRRRRQRTTDGVKVIVFGAGYAGTALVRRLLDEPEGAYRPVAILDDNPAKRRLRVHGIPVLGDRAKMAEAAAATGAAVLVIAITKASGPAIRDLTARAEQCGLTPKIVPTATEMISGGARIEGVRDPRISDLLGRRQIQTDIRAIAGHFAGKRILVTGAGGSIGSELCRQLHQFAPGELIMLDRDESALHEVQLTLHGRALLDSDETVLADIRDPRRVREVFERFRPQIVFHAAALKHLPLLERHPFEAVQSNIVGTQTVLEAAAACGAESFVNISTDKAANPVSVLGFSKRIAERLTAHMAGQADGSYLSVRFGNVLGSRGSVLGALSAQVKAGGPLTVTHPEVTRYFMTVDEAVQLVLQAAVIGGSGEVLILDMGEPVRIADIARRLAAQSAHPVDIVYTGLRPGEKLTEELLGAGEVDHRSRHPLVRHAPVKPLDPGDLAGLVLAGDESTLRRRLAECATGEQQPPAPGSSVPRQEKSGSEPLDSRRLPAAGKRPGGHPADSLTGLDVAGDDRVGRDEGMITDGDSGDDADLGADPDILADDDRCGGIAPVFHRVLCVVDVIVIADRHVLGDHASLAEHHALLRSEEAAGSQPAFRPDLDDRVLRCVDRDIPVHVDVAQSHQRSLTRVDLEPGPDVRVEADLDSPAQPYLQPDDAEC